MPKVKESIVQQHCVSQIKKHPMYGKSFFVASYPNEGARTKQNGTRLKAQGMLAGMPDLQVMAKNGVFFIEYKIKGNYLTPIQKQIHAKLLELGYQVATITALDVIDGVHQTWQQLEDWGVA